MIGLVVIGLAFVAAAIGMLRITVSDFRLFGAEVAVISGLLATVVLSAGLFLIVGPYIWPQP